MFFQNAKKGRREWFLYVMTIVLVAFGYIVGQLPMTAAIYYQMNRNPGMGIEEFNRFQENPDFSLFQIPSLAGFLLLLLIFVFALSGLYLGLRYFHNRSFTSLISWSQKIDWNRILWSFGFWLGLSILFELFMYLYQPGDYHFHRPGWSFVLLMLISLTILPIQTSFEDLLFRGYLMQGIGFALRSKWTAWVITSLLFAAVHSMNPEIREYGLLNMLPYYIIAGLFLGYITIMDDRLELALGVHAATNFFGAVLVSYEGAAIQTEALFTVNQVYALALGLVFLVFSILFSIFAHYKFKWKSPLKVFNTWEEAGAVSTPGDLPI